VQGENRVAYFQTARFGQVKTGWRRQLYPMVSNSRNLFLFDGDLRLFALPLPRREKAGLKDSREGFIWSYEPFGTGALTPAAHLANALAELPKSADLSNAPLDAEKENRLAWMGVELQALNKELARVNKVSQLTRDGRSGALVTYVYPGSPAQTAGVEQGDILLRLRVEGEPKPIEIQLEAGNESFMPEGLFDQLDQIPDELLDQMPRPWASADSKFNRVLTDIGFGRKYAAEVFHNGQPVEKAFDVVQGPVHFDSAPLHKSVALGLTVRDLTYEVRRHFQKKPDDPGVIVSKVERGGRVAVAGVRLYEIIIRVGDTPVCNTADFVKLLQTSKDEVRLSVERMNQTRVVEIRLTGRLPETPAGVRGTGALFGE
jgi:hypothetical protein